MGKAIYRSHLVTEPNVWHGDVDKGIWERGQYRSCYLVIMRLENGKFKPLLGATKDIECPKHPLPAKGHHECDTLEQAKQLLYDYVDHVRDVRDIEDITMLHKRLHRLMPNIYPA